MKQGNSELDLKNNLSTLNNGVQVNFVEQRNTWNYFMTDEVKYQICHSVPVKTKVDGHHYVSEMTKLCPFVRNHRLSLQQLKVIHLHKLKHRKKRKNQWNI